jgi:hypothetical protein
MEETLVPGGDRRRGAQDGRALVVMPSTLSWVFDVGNDYGVARSGTRQHIFPGDQVKNVAKGETGTIERIEGPFLHGRDAVHHRCPVCIPRQQNCCNTC